MIASLIKLLFMMCPLILYFLFQILSCYTSAQLYLSKLVRHTLAEYRCHFAIQNILVESDHKYP